MQYFRVDGNETIGIGHVMRCLSIAQALRARGEESTFLLADERPRSLIESHGFASCCLHSQWNRLDTEIESLCALLVEKQIPVLILDSYYVTPPYLRALRACAKTVYIDDLNRFPYPVDLLINYNIYAADMDYPAAYRRAGLSTRFALGCAYVPLRGEFASVRRVTAKTAQKLLITTGGTDGYNVAGKLLQAFYGCPWFTQTQFYVIVGKFNPNRQALTQQWATFANVHLLYDVSDMSAVMQQCDMAVTAGGVTVYELLACGLPAVLYTLADNQLQAAKTFSDKGLIPYAGDVRRDMAHCLSFISGQITALRENAARRAQISAQMQNTVDGRGCERLAEQILQLCK